MRSFAANSSPKISVASRRMTACASAANSGVAVFPVHLAHTADGSEPIFQSGFQSQVDGIVGLAEILAAFRVSNDHVPYAQGQQLWRRSLPGKRAFLLPVNILRADRGVRSFGRLHR